MIHPYHLKPFWKKHTWFLRLVCFFILPFVTMTWAFTFNRDAREGMLTVAALLIHEKKWQKVPPGWIAFEGLDNLYET